LDLSLLAASREKGQNEIRVRAEDIKRWDENHRAAAARERAATREHPLAPAQAWAAALALLAFDERMNGSPFEREDPVSLREDEEMREAWAKLRAGWRHDR
jgi:hypothetical protein